MKFTATKYKRKNYFLFSLTIFIVAGMVISTNAASVGYGQLGDSKTGVFKHTRLILQETRPG
jgi:hypothetical protein